MFGSPLPLSIGGQQPLDSMPQVLPPDMPQIKKSGMFGGGKFGIGQAIVAALNGYLAGTGNPVGSQNMQMMQQMMQAKRQREQELSDYDRKRADDNSDWRQHYDYEVSNPKPQQPSEFEQRLMQGGTMPGTPEWTAAMKAAAQNVTDPVIMTPQGPMLRSQVTGALQQPEILQTLPPGARPIGGPTPQASGGFPY